MAYHDHHAIMHCNGGLCQEKSEACQKRYCHVKYYPGCVESRNTPPEGPSPGRTSTHHWGRTALWLRQFAARWLPWVQVLQHHVHILVEGPKQPITNVTTLHCSLDDHTVPLRRIAQQPATRGLTKRCRDRCLHACVVQILDTVCRSDVCEGALHDGHLRALLAKHIHPDPQVVLLLPPLQILQRDSDSQHSCSPVAEQATCCHKRPPGSVLYPHSKPGL